MFCAMNKFFCFFIFIAILITDLNAQKLSEDIEFADSPLWTKITQVDVSRISWTKLTASGTFVIASEKPNPRNLNYTVNEIKGFAPNDGRVLFESGVKEDLPLIIDDESFHEIPNTPFFAIGGKNRGLGGSNYFVVNAVDGSVAFDTREAGLTDVDAMFVLPQSGSLLFTGSVKMKSAVALYKLESGEFWMTEKLLAKAGIVEEINGDPLEVNETDLIIPAKSALYCINIKSGEEKWRTRIPNFSSLSGETQQPPAILARHTDKPFVYLLNDNGLNAFDIATGDMLWKKYVPGNGNSIMIFDPNGIIMIGSKIFMHDYDTGEKIWDKPVFHQGKFDQNPKSVVAYEYTPQGIALVFERVAMKKEVYEINLLDPVNGALVFDKDFRLKGELLEILPCESGVLYTTDFTMGIWDASTGLDAFDPISVSIKRDFFAHKFTLTYTRPPNGLLLTAYQDEFAYVFNTEENKLYRINTAEGTLEQFNKNTIEFTNGIEPDYFEIRDKGIFISSMQSAKLVGFDGEMKYELELPSADYNRGWKFLATLSTTYDNYKKPSDPPKRQALNIRDVKYLETSKWNKTKVYMASNAAQVQVSFTDMPTIGDILNSRFDMSVQGSDYYYILTKWDKGERKFLQRFEDVGLAKINKDTGTIEKVFNFGGDRQPRFTIDEVSGKMYYLIANQLHCYKL